MVSKDQGIGGAILVVCVLIAIFYIVTLFYPSWLTYLGVSQSAVFWHSDVQFWLVAIPVFVAFIAILLIGAWIGWTMATTPPPKPIEEITSEIEEKKEEEKKEEPKMEEPKMEEPKMEEPVKPAEAPATPATEEKTPKKKK
jgi:outer membrane biosynthesis protein TonB